MKPRHRTILRELLSVPTAPFIEEAVVEAVRRWAGRTGTAMTRDAAGNVLLHYRPAAGRGRHWVFAAHMDHPGFAAVRRRGRTLWAHFRGSVAAEYFPGARVRFFAPGGEVVGRIDASHKGHLPWIRPCRLTLSRAADVPAGTVGMWDLPAMCIRGEVLAGRACDDVAGAASVLCAMEEIARRRIPARVTGLLTRAEEAGFVGCLAACESGTIPAGAYVVAIETSKAQPAARLGDGVVIRVGDRARTWDPSLTAHIAEVAARLARRDRRFRFTRQLMPGGTCESTPYSLWGHRASGLCLPLDNYHNQGPRGRIAPETIHTGDFAALVKLLTALPADPADPARADAALKRALRKRLASGRSYL
ncbi:MAG TPA: hypothetical protein VFJ30_11145 [Phycisphaerae bacterium]|nr:hypothetical protein [Phycisphaerae bacterium]